MGNIVTTIKRFISNKNTITILGVLLGIVVLYFGYNYRVDQAIDTVMVPFAKQTITATSEITQEMISTVEVLRTFVSSRDVASSGKFSSFSYISVIFWYQYPISFFFFF